MLPPAVALVRIANAMPPISWPSAGQVEFQGEAFTSYQHILTNPPFNIPTNTSFCLPTHTLRTPLVYVPIPINPSPLTRTPPNPLIITTSNLHLLL